MNDKIKKYIIPNLSYAFIGVLIGNLGEAYRLVTGADVGQKLMAAAGTTGTTTLQNAGGGTLKGGKFFLFC